MELHDQRMISFMLDEEENKPPDDLELNAEAIVVLEAFYWLRELKKALALCLNGECFYSVFIDILVDGFQNYHKIQYRAYVFD